MRAIHIQAVPSLNVKSTALQVKWAVILSYLVRNLVPAASVSHLPCSKAVSSSSNPSSNIEQAYKQDHSFYNKIIHEFTLTCSNLWKTLIQMNCLATIAIIAT